ncbi:MAG TPA: VWA domain-containing protein, partial [Candidatus Binatia bacterium]|nr:VWA domain-containing protein [Candidatus Binatia bacterium]
MEQAIPPTTRIHQTVGRCSRKLIVALVAIVFCLSILSLAVYGQSGRRATPTPSPDKPSTKSDQDEQTTNGKVVDGGETVEGDVLTVNTNLVSVPVKVMDRAGKNILNLQRKDFHIFENGVEQRIAYFATVDTPFTVVLLLDTSGSTEYKMEDIQNAAISFVNQLKPQDRVMVMSFDDKIQTFCDPTSDRQELVQAIRQTKTGDSTRLYDAVEQVIQQKLKSIAGRKAVVLFTDGVDTASGHATYKSTLKLVQESDAGVYVVAYDTSGDLFGGAASTHTINGGRIPMPGSGGTGGYPNPNGGRYPNPSGGGYPNPSGGSYPNPSGGGYPNPSGGGYPNP